MVSDYGSVSDANYLEVFLMKQDIHPSYEQITASCSCGNVFRVGSTVGKDLALDVCSECHPFYTGKQKVADAGGRVDKFKSRFGSLKSKK